MTNVDSFSYLWDGTEDGWELVQSPGRPRPAIFNRLTRMALTIENDALYDEVICTMIERGKEVLEKLP